MAKKMIPKFLFGKKKTQEESPTHEGTESKAFEAAEENAAKGSRKKKGKTIGAGSS